MSIPACNARDRVQFPADERNTLFLAQDFIWKYLWKLGENWYANDIVTQFLGNIVVSIPACSRVRPKLNSPPRRRINFFSLGFYAKPHLVKDGPQRILSM